MISKRMTPSTPETAAMRDSSVCSIPEVSAEMVTAAQPLVGMLWLMVRMLAPEEAKIPSMRERTPVLSFSIP